MKEIILCKYGEIVLKGANKKYFEDMLCREMKKRAKAYGSFDIYRAQSTIYIEATDDASDIDGMFEAARRVFGIVTVCAFFLPPNAWILLLGGVLVFCGLCLLGT